MGMYTELVMAIELKQDISKDVMDVLWYMLGDSEDEDNLRIPPHDLFKTDRWNFMLRSDSYYFDGVTDSKMRKDFINGFFTLNIRCNLKNYDDEIEKFVDWIRPYSNTTGFVGYKRYEENDEPTLIYL